MNPGARAAEQAVAVVRLLRSHPDVLAGPSVRASVSCAELTVAREAVTGEYDLAAGARLSLVHRLRVAPGVDPDEIVRRAVDAVTRAPTHSAVGGEAAEEVGDAPAKPDSSTITTATVAAPAGSGADQPPQRAEADDREPEGLLGERHLGRVLAALTDSRLSRRPRSGPAPTRGAAAPSGRLPLAPRAFRRGDRSRDVSVRHTVRAAAAAGRWHPGALRAMDRAPDVALDVVFALDCSGSMAGSGKLDRARAACRDLAAELADRGHRVGLVVFSQQPEIVSPLRRSLRGFSERDTVFEADHPTDLEAALDTARLLLRREAVATSSAHIVVISDAHPTAHGGARRAALAPGSDRSWQQMASRFGAGRGRGFGVHAARYAALVAAGVCRREGIAVSVLVPSEDSDGAFAAQLAAVGGGVVDRLPP